ncbi:hypothetical protein HY212_07810 [Candidatus Pacearchaeota archaeon]|nr:hypothetical protein [Candidatus Pacearchaeota archaeon]
MRLILDNNILFSLMKPDSSASKIFYYLNYKCEFLAPSFILSEFQEHEEECLRKSSLSKNEFERRKTNIFSKIKFIEFEKHGDFLEKAIKSSPDLDDAPYFSLALKFKIPIWSNDSLLKKQKEIKVFSTEEIIKILF